MQRWRGITSRWRGRERTHGGNALGVSLILPCLVGDDVLAYLNDAPKKRRSIKHLTDCVVTEISMSKDHPEPLYTVVSYEKAQFANFWSHEFGKEVFTHDQYFEMLLKPERRR